MVTIKGDLRVDPLVRRLGSTLRRENWLPKGAGLLVAVSGGGDSTALLLALHALAPEFDWKMEVYHAHHGTRGESADKAAAFVERLSEQLGLHCNLTHLKWAEADKRPSEERMRQLRLEALQAIAAESGLTHAVFAHTRDDLAETVLHRATRGTGLTGLASMRPVSPLGELAIVRPLLRETRQGLRLFLEDHNVEWYEDETNAQLHATRNRIRHIVRPMLAEQINPRADEALARLAEHAAQDDAQLEADVDAALKAYNNLDLAKQKMLYVVWLRSLSPALLRRVLRRWLMIHLKSAVPPSSRHIEEIIDKIHTNPLPSRWTTHGGVNLHFKHGLLIMALPARLVVHEWPRWQGGELQIQPNQEIKLIGGWRLRFKAMTGDEARAQLGNPDIWISHLDLDAVEGKLMLRTRQMGDKFTPFGHGKRRPLRRHMSDLRIPRPVRGQLPLICDEKQIIWGAACRIADAVKITPNTEHALEIRVIPPKVR